MDPLISQVRGAIAPVALEQLKAYEEAAETWPIVLDCSSDPESQLRHSNRCRLCRQNIWFAYDRLRAHIQYTSAEYRTLIVAHIRQRHAEEGINGRLVERETEVFYSAGGGYTVSGRHRDAGGHDNQNFDSRGVEFT